MTTILITGSEGLIGKTLKQKLHGISCQYIGFDKNLKNHMPEYGDICDANSFKNIISECDGIVHLAAVSRVVWGQQNPELCWQTNVIGTQNVLEAAKSSPKKPWVIYASSREVYGHQEKFPVTEVADLNPLNTYACSKVAAEKLIKNYRQYELNTAILRFSNVYGRTDDHFDRVIPAFCQAVVKNETLRIDGLNNTFDFTHVSDVCDGIIKAIKLLVKGHRLPTMHFTSGLPTSLKTLAEITCAAYGRKPIFTVAPARIYDMAKFYGCPQLAKKQIDWQPQTDLVTGISKLVSEYAKLLSITAT